MKSALVAPLIFLASVVTFAQQHQHGSQTSGQQPPPPQVFFPMAEQPEMEMHHHGEIPEVMPQFPRLGNSQRVVSGPVYQLEDLVRLATEHNPTLGQAQRAVEAARAFADDPACAGVGIDVVAFADEEGHFGNFMGSRSFVGALSDSSSSSQSS